MREPQHRKKSKGGSTMTHVKLIHENTALAPVGSNVVFRLGEGPSTETDGVLVAWIQVSGREDIETCEWA